MSGKKEQREREREREREGGEGRRQREKGEIEQGFKKNWCMGVAHITVSFLSSSPCDYWDRLRC